MFANGVIKINLGTILTFTIGIQLILIGFGVIKNDWKTEELKKKREPMLRIVGIIFVFASIIRAFLGF